MSFSFLQSVILELLRAFGGHHCLRGDTDAKRERRLQRTFSMAIQQRENLLTCRASAAFTACAGRRSENSPFSTHLSPVSTSSSPERLFAPQTMVTPLRSHWLTIPTGLRTTWKPFVCVIT